MYENGGHTLLVNSQLYDGSSSARVLSVSEIGKQKAALRVGAAFTPS